MSSPFRTLAPISLASNPIIHVLVVAMITLSAVSCSEKVESEEGFIQLFNGNNLEGWIGNVESFRVDSGVLITTGSTIYTEKEYSDFILRFEFQLNEGANNGLGIHAPLEGDPAYTGKEFQILDNTSPKYENLEPWQYHGSLYGVMPAKRGYLHPVGAWNKQEVMVQGSKIKVALNGEVILDGDYLEASENGTLDGKEHPGLLRTTGHIGFLGHGDVVKFRNIRIKVLGPE